VAWEEGEIVVEIFDAVLILRNARSFSRRWKRLTLESFQGRQKFARGLLGD
jgi:hypothetical protein